LGDIILPAAVAPLTFERYADVSVAAYAYYTPTVSGIFHASGNDFIAYGYITPEYFSSAVGAWYSPRYSTYTTYGVFIGDGTNFRIGGDSATMQIVLMRAGYSKPNPSPPIGRQRKYGKDIIVLEFDEKGFIWIEEEILTKPCEDIIPEVKEAKEKGEPHPLIGKAFTQAIKEDVEDKMGYGKYKDLLRDLGYEV